jgi:hypothetical protein
MVAARVSLETREAIMAHAEAKGEKLGTLAARILTQYAKRKQKEQK